MKRTETLRRRQHQVARRLVAPARHGTAHARLQGTAHTVLAALSVLGTIGHQLGNGAAMGCPARYPTQHGIAHAARHGTPRDGISRKTVATKQGVVEGPGGSDSSKADLRKGATTSAERSKYSAFATRRVEEHLSRRTMTPRRWGALMSMTTITGRRCTVTGRRCAVTGRRCAVTGRRCAVAMRRARWWPVTEPGWRSSGS